MRQTSYARSVVLGGLLLLCTASLRAEVVPVYGETSNAAYAQLKASFKQSRTLESVTIVLNANVRIPQQVRLMMSECRTSNAYYNPAQRTMVLCYELMEQYAKGIVRDFPGLPKDEKAKMIAGAIFFVVFHEMGHAVVHLLNLPIVAREEDVADALATYFQLKHPLGYYSIQGAAWSFSKEQSEYSIRNFADTHSLDPQRKLNIVCWAVGSNPQLYAPLAQKVGLPEQRAKRCPSEYARLQSSVRQLLGVHLVRR